MAKGGNTVPSITNAEHIGPNDTGDNIEAKRVAGYVWDPDNNVWARMTQPTITAGDVTIDGVAAFSDASDVDKKGLVDADRHVQVDVLTAPPVTVDTTGLATDSNQTDGSQKTQIVDGSNNVIAAHSNALDVSVRNASIPVTDNGGSLTVDGTVAVTDGGGSLTVDGTFWQATQPVSGPLTDTQLRASAVPVSGTFWQATQPISGTVTANLSATDNAVLDDIAATQSDNTQTTQIVDAGGDAVTVTGGKLDVNASISTTGLATDTKQDTGNASLASIDGKTPALGQALAAASVPVVMTASQLSTLTPPTNTGYSTSAKQDTGNASLSSIDGKITAVNTGAVVVSSSALPSGAATAAKQPALGTAGTSSPDVITVQGRSGMTALLTDGSATTQPVSNAGLTELAAAINSSKLDVNIVSSDVASGGTAAADDADFTAGTTLGTPAQGVYESTPTSVTDGDLGIVGITAGRRLKTSATLDTALPAGTNNIGDVDVLTLPVAFNTGTRSATTQRVTIATDDVVPVSDNGGSLTVDGSVTANAGTNLNTSALALETGGNLAAAATSLGALGNSVDGNYLNTNMNIAGVDVDSNSGAKSAATQRIVIATDQPQLTNALKVDGSAVTQPVSLAVNTPTLQSGSTTAVTQATAANLNATVVGTGTFTTQENGAALTALQLIDDSIATTGSAVPAKGTLASGTDGTNARVLKTDASGELQIDVLTLPTLPAGTNAIGKLAANSGVDIGDVDVTSLPVAFNTGTRSATTQRVTIATDDLVPVTGTITAVTAITNALPAGTNAIGKLAANSGVDIGDVDVTSTTFPTLSTASTYSPTSFQNLGANATLNVKNSAGNVYSLYCNNENTADRFIQLHNTATTPSAAAVPLYTFRVPPRGDILIGTDFFTVAGANFSTGIAFAFSTTKDTYTAGTAGDHSTIVMYK